MPNLFVNDNDPQDSTWHKEGVKKRVISISVKPNDDMRKFREDFFKAAVIINRMIYRDVRATVDWLEQKREDEPSPLLLTKKGNFSGAADIGWQFMQHHRKELDRIVGASGTGASESLQAVVYSLMERYVSGYERNGKLAKRPVRLHPDKAIRIRKTMCLINLQQRKIEMLPFAKSSRTDDRFDVPITIAPRFLKAAHMMPLTTKSGKLKNTLSGNLSKLHRDKWTLAYAGDVPIEWLYEPTCFLGMDLNKRPETFLALSMPLLDGRTLLPHNDTIIQVVSDLRSINQQIKHNNKTVELSTEERCLLRNESERLLEELDTLLQEYVDAIIETAIAKKACVCIDNVKTGNTNGAYGQSIAKMLKEQCENKSVPFVIVPCAYTTKYCSGCHTIYTSKKCRSEDFSIFHCPQCGDIDADLKAAQNGAKFGERIWNEGMQAHVDWMNVIRISNEQPNEGPAF
jgi:hypothetical protein